jgi:hypothetical protein
MLYFFAFFIPARYKIKKKRRRPCIQGRRRSHGRRCAERMQEEGCTLSLHAMETFCQRQLTLIVIQHAL